MAIDTGAARPDLLGGEGKTSDRVLFRISGLYGLVRGQQQVPVSPTETVDSGPVLLTLDPESDPSASMGVADFEASRMRMRNTLQFSFGGLLDLAKSGNYDRALLNPPRGISTTDATINPDYSGWEAQTCLDFLPGSMWSGAGGG
jgi:hypothetical protein